MRSAQDDEVLAAQLGHPPQYWWVNHGRELRHELEGGYLWCAKRAGRSTGAVAGDNMARAVPGDVVFSFAEERIGALGVVTERVRTAPAPGARRASSVGWLLPVRFETLAQPLTPAAHLAELGPLLPAKHPPLRAGSGRGTTLYLAAVPPRMAALLRELLAGQLQAIEAAVAIETDGRLADAAVEEQIWRRTDVALRDKRQLVSARFGQGVFRQNLESFEKLCRVTGVPDRRHLRASHIKPWRLADDREKLDGFNGLLLSPHVEHLFARGHISFADDGHMLLSKHLNPTVAKAWSLDKARVARPFRPEQRAYLEFHRRHVFEKLSSGRRT